MTDILDALGFTVLLFIVGFGSLVLVLLLAEIAERLQERRGR